MRRSTANQGGGVIVYERRSGKQVFRIGSKFDCSTFLFGFTPDGKRLVTHRVRGFKAGGGTESFLYEVHVWQAKTGKLLRRFDIRRGQGLYPHLYDLSEKGLIVGGRDEVATIYDLDTGKAISTIPGKDRPRLLSLSRDGRWLVTAGMDDSLCVWNVEKRALLHRLYQHTSRVWAVAISVDGAWCASLTKGNRVWVFDRSKGSERARTRLLFWGSTGPWILKFAPDGKTLVAAGDGAHHGLMVWDWQTYREVRGGYPPNADIDLRMNPKKWNDGAIGDLSMAADGELLTIGGDGLHLWDLRPPVSPEPPRRPAKRR